LTWDGVNLNIGTYAGTGDCELRLFGSTPNNSFSTLKTTNGNLHIDSDNGHTIYLNYYSGGGTSVIIGNGNGGSSNTIFSANGDVSVGANLTASGTVTATGGFLVPYQAATKKPMINLVGATTYGLWHTEGSNDIFSFDFGGVSKHQFFQTGNAVFAGEVQAASLDINGAGDFSGKVDFQGTAAIEGGSGYGVFKGYTTNDNHFIAVRGIVANTATLSITGGHQTTFVEHADSTSEGWYFKSKTTGAYREIARIDGTNQMFLGGNKVWNAGNDGAGSGLDADTVDGLQATSFIRSNTSDVATGRISFRANQTNNWDTIATGSGSQGGIEIYNDGGGNDAFMSFHAGGDFALYFGLDADSNDLAVGGWSMGANKYKIWHAGNDGPGSGLDADTVDGIQASRIVYGAGSRKTNNQDPNTAFNSGFYDISTTNAPTSTWYSYITMAHTNESNKHGHQIAGSFYSDGDLFNRHYDGNGSFGNWTRIWNEANDGAGSGLDADLLDGQQGSYYAAAGSLNNYLLNTTDTFTGALTIAGYIRGNGQQLVLNAGESYSYATGQTNEHVYANAEGGLIVSSSPDNWSSGWAGRNTTYIGKADGTSSFPGKISVQGSNVIEIDQGTSSFNHVKVLSTFGSKLFSATNYGYVLEGSSTSASPVTFRFDNDRYRIYSGSSGEALTVLANTKVGINNTNPTYQLHVSGNARVYRSGLVTSSSQTRDKISVWNSLSSYTIGMKNGFGYGGLGGDGTGTDYAMSFQMSNTTNRGWWWGDTSHSDVQGSMSLTTDGELVVAKSLSVGAGETTRTAADRPLEVTGNALIDGRLTIEGPAPTATSPMLELHRTSPVVDYKDLNSSGYVYSKDRFLNSGSTVIASREVVKIQVYPESIIISTVVPQEEVSSIRDKIHSTGK
jgi:hypothetical protein